MAKQMAFYFDQSACTGCKACVIACKSKNNLPVGVNWRRVYDYGGGGWMPDPQDSNFMVPTNVFAYSLSVSCMHCVGAKCVEVCPTTAMHRGPDGIILHDQSKCIGCRYCQWACPYEAPQYVEEKGVMSKCDFCADLLAKGEQPFCVAACVMRALDFGDLQELRAKHGLEAAIEPLPDPKYTSPSFVMTPHPNAQKSGHGTGRILKVEEA